jgi:hypothetical protein
MLIPSQLLLMLLTGLLTEVEYSPTVLPALTTLSFWSVLSEDHGRSRTPGELDGESLDLLDLEEETPVEFVPMLVSTHNDLNDHQIF